MLRIFLYRYLYEPLKYLYKLAVDSDYRNFWILRSKMSRIPRYTECNAKISGWNLLLPDSASFISAYEEIFVNRIYEFKTSTSRPYILDVGANVGVSTLFFKTLLPSSEIIAFEADPKIYDYLCNNVHGNGFNDVTMYNKAVWYEKTLLKFRTDGADGGRISADSSAINTIEVESIDLGAFLNNRKVDFLKMDIEGAETEVLLHCSKYLGGVENIFIEYHSAVGDPQCLDQLLGVLKQNGFRYHMHLHPALNNVKPYLNKKLSFCNYNMLMNIFAWRENH